MFRNINPKKQARLQWLQDLSQINGDNSHNEKCGTSRHLRNKKRKYLKDKINEFSIYTRNRDIRDLYRRIYEFKKGY
jgi:hypothetical protein